MGIFDPQQPDLSPELFLPNGKMQPAFKVFLLEHLFKLVEPQLLYRLWLLGSTAGHYYSETSDIDVNVTLIHMDEDKLNAYSEVIKNSNRGGTLLYHKHPLNFFIKPFESARIDVERAKNAGGLYDVINDKWVKKESPVPEGFMTRVQMEEPYHHLLLDKLQLEIAQAQEHPSVQEATDVHDTFQQIDDDRKAFYSEGIGTPRFSEGNVAYKLVEKQFGDYPEKIHHLVRLINKLKKIT